MRIAAESLTFYKSFRLQGYLLTLQGKSGKQLKIVPFLPPLKDQQSNIIIKAFPLAKHF
jgi:hypothetical protein